jgi:TPR repeat protein
VCKLFLTWTILTLCCFCTPVLAVEPSICYGAKFSEVDLLSDLPSQVKQLLGIDEKGLSGIAERGKPYNVTDAVDEKLPMRRFSIAAVSSDCILVAYEQGGIGYNVSLKIFLRDGAEWQRGEKMPDPRQNLVLGFRVPRNLDEMLKYSQYALGEMYANGFGAAKNDSEALKWYHLAADQGVSNAQFALGRMYAGGRGVEKNEDEALKWFKLAAYQNVYFQYELGMMYKYGRTLRQNYAEAFKWLKFAADKGHANAQEELGSLYAGGKGVKKDDVEAVRLFRLAANQPNNTALYRLGVMYANGRGVVASRVVAFALFRLNHSDVGQRIISNWMPSDYEINAGDTLYKELLQALIQERSEILAIIDRYIAEPAVIEERVMYEKVDGYCYEHVDGRVVTLLPGQTGSKVHNGKPYVCEPPPSVPADLDV